MGRRSAPTGSRCARLCEELLDMGARVAVRSYSHNPHTGRMYYKPPSTPATAAGDSGNGASSSCSSPGSGPVHAASGGAGASEAATRRRQQEEMMAKMEFHGSEFILYGVGRD